eukprot:TRINITY_DN5123_c0_g1_i5.p2 TRINITY_DN5123_c0_g1~~TRINITY_DN5123_c0_g1_i5.p2  ORF type:complete len:147 (-),score=27.00 TRINITY_DN5123_c0_g1_i5:66-506(-)
MIYVPSIVMGISFFAGVICWSAKEVIFGSFTTDPSVLQDLNLSFPYWLAASIVGCAPGVFEGLAIAKEKWVLLFISICQSVAFWLVLSLINVLWLNYLPLVWVASLIFLYSRFLLVCLVLVIEDREIIKKETQATKESSTLTLGIN